MRRSRIDRVTAERLLAGGDTHTSPDDTDRVVNLLAAAGAPATPGELAGEQEALAAFRAAQIASAEEPRHGTIRTLVAKLLTVKAAGAAVVVAGASGLALAATLGVLPAPFGGPGGSDSSPSPHLPTPATGTLAPEVIPAGPGVSPSPGTPSLAPPSGESSPGRRDTGDPEGPGPSARPGTSPLMPPAHSLDPTDPPALPAVPSGEPSVDLPDLPDLPVDPTEAATAPVDPSAPTELDRSLPAVDPVPDELLPEEEDD